MALGLGDGGEHKPPLGSRGIGGLLRAKVLQRFFSCRDIQPNATGTLPGEAAQAHSHGYACRLPKINVD